MSFFCILDIWFANIYSYSKGCLFILLTISLLCRSILPWCSSTCLFFIFASAFGVTSKNSLTKQCQGAYPYGVFLVVLLFQIFRNLLLYSIKTRHFTSEWSTTTIFRFRRFDVHSFLCMCTEFCTFYHICRARQPPIQWIYRNVLSPKGFLEWLFLICFFMVM